MTGKQITVQPLFGGADQRCVTLLDAVLDLVHERAKGMPFPAVLGVLRLVEARLISEQLEDFEADHAG